MSGNKQHLNSEPVRDIRQISKDNGLGHLLVEDKAVDTLAKKCTSIPAEDMGC